MERRRSRIFASLSDTFWVLVLAVVVLFAFFVALGAFSPGEVAALTLVVIVLAVLWLAHAIWDSRHRDAARPGRDPRARTARVLTLRPEIQAQLDRMNAAPGPPAHEVPVEEARAAHTAETERLCGAGEPVAEVRDVTAPTAGGDLRVRATGRTSRVGSRRLPPRRRVDDGHARELRRSAARARQRLRRPRGLDRLPARARAPLPGGGRRHAARVSAGSPPTPASWAATARGSRWPATAPAATSRPSRRCGCAASCRCAPRR